MPYFPAVLRLRPPGYQNGRLSRPAHPGAAKAMPSGFVLPAAARIVAITCLDAAEMTETVPDSPFPTQIWAPSGVAAMDMGSRPTPMVPVTRPETGDTTETASASMSAVYTDEPATVTA